ncbi:hypothetical protein L1049_009598 [Liquidambar formosana]|uniref:Uncharacterized protein n=1 Tax=Liquidambar formosana TaxID=63359 RepID=A0AAP0R457_LIQFO
MKKLYRKGTVHPSPPFISDQLAFLPATILTLTAVLSPEDREVLAYLLSCSNSAGNISGHRKNNTQKSLSGGKGGEHPPLFNCSCFRCYMSYWVRWDSSPNRQVIHEIIDAFEDGLLVQSNKSMKNRKERRKRGCNNGSGELKRDEMGIGRDEPGESESVEETGGGSGGGCGEEGCGDDDVEEGGEKGSVRKLVSLIGERIWNVWSQ